MKNPKRDDMTQRHDAELDVLIEEYYSEPKPPDEFCFGDSIWYQSHYAVASDKKPGMCRIVFDCAIKCQDKSLKDRCMLGPGPINKLLQVSFRFGLD